MQKAELLQLYDYNYWATRRILAAAAQVSHDLFVAPRSFSHGGLRGTLMHTLAAEWIWRVRCQERQYPTALLQENDFPTLATLRTRWQTEEAAMRGYLNSLSETAINQPLSYKGTDGAAFEHPLWLILVHVVNHGTQHRGEAAAILTDLGHSPGNIDLIIYVREQKR